METYEVMVRIQSNNMVVRTRVQANSSQDALWLLEGQWECFNPSIACELAMLNCYFYTELPNNREWSSVCLLI